MQKCTVHIFDFDIRVHRTFTKRKKKRGDIKCFAPFSYIHERTSYILFSLFYLRLFSRHLFGPFSSNPYNSLVAHFGREHPKRVVAATMMSEWRWYEKRMKYALTWQQEIEM